MKIYFTFCLLALILCGCVPPKYQQFDRMTGGYTNKKVSNHIYEIGYKKGLATFTTNPILADEIIMRRAAEVCVEEGYNYFTYEYYPLTEKIRIACFDQQSDQVDYLCAISVLENTDELVQSR